MRTRNVETYSMEPRYIYQQIPTTNNR